MKLSKSVIEAAETARAEMMLRIPPHKWGDKLATDAMEAAINAALEAMKAEGNAREHVAFVNWVGNWATPRRIGEEAKQFHVLIIREDQT